MPAGRRRSIGSEAHMSIGKRPASKLRDHAPRREGEDAKSGDAQAHRPQIEEPLKRQEPYRAGRVAEIPVPQGHSRGAAHDGNAPAKQSPALRQMLTEWLASRRP